MNLLVVQTLYLSVLSVVRFAVAIAEIESAGVDERC